MFDHAFFLAGRDLAYMLRQRETLVWVFVMPFLFFWFLGTMTGGGGVAPSLDQELKLLVSGPSEGGVVLRELHDALRREHFSLVFTDDREELEAAKRYLELPQDYAPHADLSAAVAAGEPVKLRFVRDGGGSSADLEKLRVYRAVYGVLADLAVLKANGAALDEASMEALHAEPRTLSLAVESAGARETIPSGYSQTIPGTMVMFTMMILLTSGSILLVTEREQGLLRRLASTPISRGSVVLGKWMGKLGLSAVQLAFAMAAGTLVFGMDWGPSLPMVFLLLVAWAAFCASLSIVMANRVRTSAQMSGLGVLVTLLLAALGGCWWPIEITADWMQTLAAWLPTGWTMGAMHQLVNFAHPPSSAVGAVTALLVGALVLGWLGARSFRYE